MGSEGVGRVSAANSGGGGLNIFFSRPKCPPSDLGGRFGYFLFFLLGGVGKGSPRGRERGGGFSWKIPGGGGSPRRVGAGGRGAGRVFEGNLGI